MTKQRTLHCENLNCPFEDQLKFSDWVRLELPDSAIGYLVSDIDFVLSNYKTKKIMLLEIKTRNGIVKDWQRSVFKNLAKWISKGISDDWKFLGFHLIRFENTCFFDGNVYFDKQLMTEEEIIKKLTF